MRYICENSLFMRFTRNSSEERRSSSFDRFYQLRA